jgi:Ca2+-binding RTX toxin-like protein
MIQYNTIVENGVTPHERVNSLKYQLALIADQAGPLTFNAFLATNPSFENALTAHINALVSGVKVPVETREHAALFSLEYSHTFNSGNEATDSHLTTMLSAIKSGDRASAWYEMRYALNPSDTVAAAREHFDEAQVFGLFQNAAPSSRDDVGVQESLLALRMATQHEKAIGSYENSHAAGIATAQSDIDLVSLRTKSDYGMVSTIDDTLAPAVGRLVYDYTDLAHLASDLNNDLSPNSPLITPAFGAVWVAPNLAGDQGTAHMVDRSEATGNDLIFGSITIASPDSGANDTLLGGAGNDFFVPGKGGDAIDGGGGEDTVSYLDAGGALIVDLGNGIGTKGAALGDTYTSIENVLGGAGNDKLTGSTDDNLFYGGAGNDKLIGAEGSDTLIGGTGADTIWGDALGQKDIELSSVAQADLLHGNTLVGGLGGTAGFGEASLGHNDDGSTGAIDISGVFGEAGLDFFGTSYTHLYVNNNGNITFGSALSAFTPGEITAGFGNPIIAPFWADVDTRNGEGAADLVYYDLDAANGVFTVTWNQVGWYSEHQSPSDSFQLQLIDERNGNFDIVFRYENIGWTTGEASDGLPARAGWAAGNGTDYFELSQSGDDTGMRDLPATTGNTGIEGVFVFHVINGEVFGADDTIDGGPGIDHLNGGPGADLFVFHAGEANGDVVTDFNEVSGDRLQFLGYDDGATFAQIDATHWQIGSDVITFSNAPIISASDYIIDSGDVIL